MTIKLNFWKILLANRKSSYLNHLAEVQLSTMTVAASIWHRKYKSANLPQHWHWCRFENYQGEESWSLRTKHILDQADQQKEAPLTNSSKRGRSSISTGGNTYFVFRDLSNGSAISKATSLLRKDLKLRVCIGDPNPNQKNWFC